MTKSGEAAVPEHVQPGRALRPGTQQPGGREQAGKAEAMGDRRQRRAEVAAGQYQHGPRSGDPELAEQQQRGDEVADDERRLVQRHEGPDLRQRQLGERRDGGKQRQRDQHDREGQPALAQARGPAREQRGRGGTLRRRSFRAGHGAIRPDSLPPRQWRALQDRPGSVMEGHRLREERAIAAARSRHRRPGRRNGAAWSECRARSTRAP